MDRLRAKTLISHSRFRSRRSTITLDVMGAVGDSARVAHEAALGPIVMHVYPVRPWWHTLGVHTFLIWRRALAGAEGRVERIKVDGLGTACAVWGVVLWGLLLYWLAR